MGTSGYSRRMPRGRWRVERERCQIEDPVAPPPDRDAVGIGQAIALLLARTIPATPSCLAQIEAEWPSFVGDAAARHARPGALKNRHLVVFVDSSTWLSEIERYSRTTILSRLQKRFGADAIASVTLRLDPDGLRPG